MVVIGASLSGLFAAAAAAEAGRSVTIVERDALTEDGEPRRGVPQGRQSHLLLHRGLVAAEELVPGLERAIEDAGAVRVNTGHLPWYGPFGWQADWVASYDVLSLTRPRLEQLVRERVLARPGMRLVTGTVKQLRRGALGWVVATADGTELVAGLVVDASGRSSRMPHWLAALGRPVPEPEVLDAGVGYACQVYRTPSGEPLPTGLVVGATPETPRLGLGLPVEGGRWLVSAAGYGASRPGRENFQGFLETLREPTLAAVTAGLVPVGEPALHRETGNRRHHYGRQRSWPDGLLVVGDALCAFDPLYGQGITVGVCQALVLRDALRQDAVRRGARRRVPPQPTRRLQRRIARVADLPWSVATTEDSRYLPGVRRRIGQRLATSWTNELALVGRDGHRRTITTFGGVYHLMTPPWQLVHPALVAAVVHRRLRRRSSPAPRPAVLASLLVTPVR